jgi:hypothetical protein
MNKNFTRLHLAISLHANNTDHTSRVEIWIECPWGWYQNPIGKQIGPIGFNPAKPHTGNTATPVTRPPRQHIKKPSGFASIIAGNFQSSKLLPSSKIFLTSLLESSKAP